MEWAVKMAGLAIGATLNGLISSKSREHHPVAAQAKPLRYGLQTRNIAQLCAASMRKAEPTSPWRTSQATAIA